MLRRTYLFAVATGFDAFRTRLTELRTSLARTKSPLVTREGRRLLEDSEQWPAEPSHVDVVTVLQASAAFLPDLKARCTVLHKAVELACSSVDEMPSAGLITAAHSAVVIRHTRQFELLLRAANQLSNRPLIDEVAIEDIVLLLGAMKRCATRHPRLCLQIQTQLMLAGASSKLSGAPVTTVVQLVDYLQHCGLASPSPLVPVVAELVRSKAEELRSSSSALFLRVLARDPSGIEDVKRLVALVVASVSANMTDLSPAAAASISVSLAQLGESLPTALRDKVMQCTGTMPFSQIASVFTALRLSGADDQQLLSLLAERSVADMRNSSAADLGAVLGTLGAFDLFDEELVRAAIPHLATLLRRRSWAHPDSLCEILVILSEFEASDAALTQACVAAVVPSVELLSDTGLVNFCAGVAPVDVPSSLHNAVGAGITARLKNIAAEDSVAPSSGPSSSDNAIATRRRRMQRAASRWSVVLAADAAPPAAAAAE